MNIINFRKALIVILIITIIIMGLGFIIVSSKYHSLISKTNNFNIEFTKVKKLTSVKGGKSEPTGSLDIKKNGKLIDFNFKLYNENDTLSYEVTILNSGTIDAEIDDIMMSPDYLNTNKSLISPVSISMTDVSGKILEPGEELKVKINAFYNPSSIKGDKQINGRIGIISSGSE